MDVLVVVDMQNDFIDGTLGTSEAVAIVPKVAKKMRTFQGRVLCTRDTHETAYLDTQEGRKLPVEHCIRGTVGWQLAPDIEAVRKELPIDKPTFGSLALGQLLKAQNEELQAKGESIGKITLIGLCTDICVISNALLLKVFLPETEIAVDAACCAGVTPERHKTALEALKACQITVENEA
ncbi:Nicotinamidase-related amidase [Oscillibacter sp. PC13]|uniref:cysteine hydrolase family protein n=1 Tax=Oscillibacter sp. PC13 TaxID=1855299 RepID=UPI0008EC88BC|nr:cysteine hydrolase [Oscillibacter sp. PC13]SFP40554.1 Nicotinamidase-related amidase [Oscillibacter sp. PC13]